MRKISLIYLLLTVLCTVSKTYAQEFHHHFRDSTLRIDYTFSGNVELQNISIDQLNVSPRWYGKKKRLTELPVEGNGQITVRDHHTGKVIYKNSFSSLFQEWLSYDEAKTNSKSFENVLLIPMPKDTVEVTLDLRNNRRQVVATLTHRIIPSDILIKHIGFKDTTPYEVLSTPKDTNNCIRIAYIAEGYQKSEMSTFIEDAKKAMNILFTYEPFKSYKDRFQVIAVKSPSRESGTSEPGKGIWKNTALHSHFDTFYSDRYLTTLHLKDLHDWLAGLPYEHIIVLVNTDKYGGGGILNSYNLTAAHHKLTPQVVVHEFGHSFAGLGDEYGYESEQIPMYPHDIEPWEPNLTTLVDFHNKWEDMLDQYTPVPTPITDKNKSKVGVYEGAGYALKGMYRPMMDCRMRTNEYPYFCPVCERALRRLIQFYTE